MTTNLRWSDDWLLVDSTIPLGQVLAQLRDPDAPMWVAIRRHNGLHLYAFRPHELLRWGPLRRALATGANTREAIEKFLELHEEHSSTKTKNRAAPPPIDRSWRRDARAPSIPRYIEVDDRGEPRAVGSQSDDVLDSHGTTGRVTRGPRRKSLTTAQPTETVDEGTTPTRHPSIDVAGSLQPGVEVAITVDLLREAVSHTQGGALSVPTLDSDWKSLSLLVILQCAWFEIASPQATVTIHRNAASTPAVFKAKLKQGAPAGALTVTATFLHETRYCGSAQRTLYADGQAPQASPSPPANGIVAVDTKAATPDVTIHISRLEKDDPRRLRWLVVTPRFPGLPARLEEDIELDADPAAQATTLFNELAVLTRGQHVQRMQGFGSRLWALAPPMFRAVYWVLWDHYKRPLAIQFISDEPHIPWELTRPSRADDSETHEPLAIKHAVARWLKRYDGLMSNELPGGRIHTIAPKYQSASRALKRAQVESDTLVKCFDARQEPGTRAAVLKLLETDRPADPVAILHFAGHGTFSPAAAIHSSIKLEDGDLAASEVDRPEVQLGRACRTLIFFNACEIGAAGAVFGEVGGWADAFLTRRFSGFIAPLWSVDDEDAGVVAADLLTRIFKQREGVADALRAVRAAHGATSPTFYSYLFYGDVTARIR